MGVDGGSENNYKSKYWASELYLYLYRTMRSWNESGALGEMLTLYLGTPYGIFIAIIYLILFVVINLAPNLLATALTGNPENLFSIFLSRNSINGKTYRYGVSDDILKRAIKAQQPVIIALHGTGDNSQADFVDSSIKDDNGKMKERWWQIGSDYQKKISEGMITEVSWLPFHWAGGNSDFDRNVASRRLSKLLGYLSKNETNYYLIGHSHAGNIIDNALGRYGDLAGSPKFCQYIVTYGAPFFRSSPVLTKIIYDLARLLAFVSIIVVMIFGFYYIWNNTENLTQIEVWVYIIVCFGAFGFSFYGISVGDNEKVGGYRNLFNSIIYRPIWNGAIRSRWVAFASDRDEVLGLLPKLNSRSFQLISKRAIYTPVNRFGLFVSRMCGFPLLSLLLIKNVPQDLNFNLNSQSMLIVIKYLLSNVAITIIATICVVLFFRMVGFLVTSPVIAGENVASQWLMSLLRGAFYGQDDEYNIEAVEEAPQFMSATVIWNKIKHFGKIEDEKIAQTVDVFYDEIVNYKEPDKIARNLDRVLKNLFGAIYHNAYFDDPSIIRKTLIFLQQDQLIYASEKYLIAPLPRELL